MTENNYLQQRPLYRKLKDETDARISPEAAEKLREYLEHKASEIAEEAQTAANHADRKTIKAEDINFVLPNTEYIEDEDSHPQ